MKNLLAKIWVPALLVAMAAVQSFGIDAGRTASLRRLADSLSFSQLHDTTSVFDSTFVTDTIADTVAVSDSNAVPVLTARDTIVVPDSLQYTDPFKYKYYIAIKDSSTRRIVRDSLMNIGDSLEIARLDSLYLKDSTDIAEAEYAAWYASLTRKQRKKHDIEKALP